MNSELFIAIRKEVTIDMSKKHTHNSQPVIEETLEVPVVQELSREERNERTIKRLCSPDAIREWKTRWGDSEDAE